MVATDQVVSILLVDDKHENLLALAQLLERPDRQLVTAHSGNDALRISSATS